MSQLERLVQLGVPALADRTAEEFRRLGADLPDRPDAVLAVHPSLVPASALTPLLARSGKPGFVVEDLTDLDRFVPVPTVEIPDRPLYLITEPDRGDDLRNWSPHEAVPELAARGRSPLTISEGISWLLQQPDRLEPNFCFMCPASRKTNDRGRLDARTPAIWISGGTGRDGRDRRDAPKVGWCWAGNRHTWLGFGSTTGRLSDPAHRPAS
ncbi:DUF5701 family protein [Microlunatus speluncae]|uniref:DUF5701 family protein n=1 Tax=Microlunatus speluncae TaxID=2594267 RepID=UPI0012665DA2|nr:DUF5701 family protein [Microlunatus speluncae]